MPKGLRGFQKGHPNTYGFQKGNKFWLGKKHSEESKLKMSLAQKGVPSKNKGRKLSEEFKKRLSVLRKGVKFSKEHRKNLSLSQLGKKVGAKHHNWKGGITPINEKIRKSVEYKMWQRACLERDNFMCVWGGKEHGNKLEVDHIKPFALFPELRFAIDNGRTLCVACHRSTDTYGGKIHKYVQ